MVETRAAPRYRVAKAAIIEVGGAKIPCSIFDLSVTGAALDISNLVYIPAHFTLVVKDDGLRLHCHVVWRRPFRIGVAFDQI
jgi:PilZ domain-containing protein